jgi:protoporphyrinogen oxidase
MSDKKNASIVIIGGGITGLVSAYLAAKAGKNVILVEKGEKIGGLLNTFSIGGNQLEFFYHHFFTHDAELTWLLEELNLLEKVEYKKTSMGVYRDGTIYDFNSPTDLIKFKPINWFGKVRFGLTTLFLTKIAQWRNFENVSAYDWFRKWAGKSATKGLWGPMLNVKFGPYFNKIPLAWMIGRLRQRMSSRKQGDERLGYLKGSLQVLCDTLKIKLEELGVEIQTNTSLEKIDISNGMIQSIQTSAGTISGDNFLFTLPTVHLKSIFGLEKSLAQKLNALEYFGVYCMVLELSRPLSHVYWLNVADEGFSFGGVIEHTNLISPSEYNGKHIVYLSRYFAHEEPIAKWSSDEVKTRMRSDLKRIYPNLNDEEIDEEYLFRSNTAAMVTDLKFSQKVPGCQTLLPNMYLCNMAHIYPDERSVNNSIRIAAEALNCMGIDTRYVPKNLSLSGKIGF